MSINAKIAELTNKLESTTIERRRDFHRHAEAGWTEFRTASIVADQLTKLGYKVQVGDEVVDSENMMGVPASSELSNQASRAIEQGANPEWVNKMEGGKTGVMGIMEFNKPGPTIALRFDLDANDANEAETNEHRPYSEKFNSINKGAMHACGHDGHTAVGLAVAEIIAELKGELRGTIKFIFQPAEEGVRGAKAMVAKGIVDDVDYLLGMHFGFQLKKTGQIACNVTGFLATSKYDATFTGVPAHAGAAPEVGRNALLAAAAAVLNLHAIPRHSEGTSRINVGTMQAGSGRNVIAPKAVIKLETRGGSSTINKFMSDEAYRIINSAATMHDVKVEITEMGGAAGCSNSPELADDLAKVAEKLGIFNEIVPECDFGASEDCSYFMERVQEKGGQAAYTLIGAGLAAGHHDSCFDFDENALAMAVRFVSTAATDLLLR
ncbi:Indole-3-acetyl-aspartic acid hydrolase [bioreactor metagenome]|uniref:Indole-3-acetyl-aspartic acid hydrolase n=1 Tax=bioreactor metagenome TaxID=1076179 RepID=A0A644TR22_9ZZZZ|nr:amidohydrolase [Negativicutes bacterium]